MVDIEEIRAHARTCWRKAGSRACSASAGASAGPWPSRPTSPIRPGPTAWCGIRPASTTWRSTWSTSASVLAAARSPTRGPSPSSPRAAIPRHRRAAAGKPHPSRGRLHHRRVVRGRRGGRYPQAGHRTQGQGSPRRRVRRRWHRQVATASGVISLPAVDVLADRCLECRNPFPLFHDVVFGDKVDDRSYGAPFKAVTAAEAESDENRWEFLGASVRALHPLLRLPGRLPDVLLRRMRGGQHGLHRRAGHHRRGQGQPHPLDRALADAAPRTPPTTSRAPCTWPAAASTAANANASARSTSPCGCSTTSLRRRRWKCLMILPAPISAKRRSSRRSATVTPTTSSGRPWKRS